MLRLDAKAGKKPRARRPKAGTQVVPRAVRARTPDDGATEDRGDVDAARKALADAERIPYEQVRRNLGL
jgi:hypothetical protein